MKSTMKHVIITGGAGFIGSHLCDAFLERGYAVTAIDNLITGQMKNLTQARSHAYFHFFHHDVSQPLDTSALPFLNSYGLTGVLHFACPASPIDFDRIPFEILSVDSLGTMHTVELALLHQARYLLASTSEIYGDPLVHPQPENYWGNVNTLGPRACYDETKRFAEAYVSTAQHFKKLNAGIVRIFNTYGPRMRADDGRIVPEFCKKAIAQEPLSVHGDGEQTRSFCFISDLVEGIIRLFESPVQEPINLGNSEEWSVLKLAQAVCQWTHNPHPIVHLPARMDDPRKRRPVLDRAAQHLNWSPQVSLAVGLQHTLDYFRNEA